jgi:hypothetical protein
MSSPFSRISKSAVVLAVALCYAAHLPAATPLAAADSAGPATTPIQVSAGNPVPLLRTAYLTLATADHDYKGHRVKAMKAIEAACTLLGTSISGDGKGRERQPISDAQLRQALGEVQQASALVPAGKTQKKIVAHLDKAISELTTALTIK